MNHTNAGHSLGSLSLIYTDPTAQAMMATYAAQRGWSDPLDSTSYLRQYRKRPDLTKSFGVAAALVHDLLPPQPEGAAWRTEDILDDVCAAFGVWVHAYERKHGWPVEPVLRHWLQEALWDHILGHRNVWKRELQLIVPTVLVLPVADYIAAVTQAGQLLSGTSAERLGLDMPPHGRYWILSGRDERHARDEVVLHCAVEIAAAVPDQGYAMVEHYVSSVGAANGIGQYYDDPAGRIVAQGKVTSTCPRSAPISHQQLASSGLLPMHFH